MKAKKSKPAGRKVACDHTAILCEVDRVHGAIRLARAAVFAEAGTNEELTSAWEVLDLATDRLCVIRHDLEHTES